MKWFLRALPFAMGFVCMAIAAQAQTYSVLPMPYMPGYAQVVGPNGVVIVNIEPVPYMPDYYIGMRPNGSTAFTIDPMPFLPGEYTIDTSDAFK